MLSGLSQYAVNCGMAFFTVSVVLFVVAITLCKFLPAPVRITYMVKSGLFAPAHGNPLHLKDGELLPAIRCKQVEKGVYELFISAQQSVTVDTICNAAPSISAALNHHFGRYAVIQVDADTAFNGVTFWLSDVKVDTALTFRTVDEMKPESPTKLRVDKRTTIDLTTSGSILCAGKTRSGKTYGLLSLLIQVALCGRDDFESTLVVIDPKQAELSRLAHTITLDEDGGARGILSAVREFAATITKRQRYLNELSEVYGDAVKWYEARANFHPSFIFLDEFVACRSLFPKKASKEDPTYCLDEFDNLLKRVVTMGASAGCFVILSTAEASVQEGGLPAMLRAAFSTRILFRPTVAEGRLMWDAVKLENFAASRVYGVGEAWFSSTDGVHDAVSVVKFPRLEFPAYKALGELLQAYYD